ncbi:AMP-binding protein [Micromonospora echinaurantiaca]|nr:AMP-binding protein [Micromonospora echinaurantiaca]
MTSTNIFDLLCKQSVAQSDDVAYIGTDREYSYAELFEQSRSAGNLISAAMTRPGPVAVITSMSAARVPAVLAVAAAGGTLIPMDLEWPAEWRRTIIEKFACTGVLTDDASMLDELDGTVLPVPVLGGDLVMTACRAKPITTWQEHLSTLQYLIFTSGSTGAPKGVGMSVDAARRHIVSTIAWLNLAPSDRVLQFARLAFDTSQEEIWPALFAGATVVAGVVTTPTFSQLQNRIRDCGVTVLELPTAYWRQWASYLRDRQPDLPSLATVILGGEAAYECDAHMWRAGGLGRVRLINSYGPTEAGITASAYEVPAMVPDTPDPLPIGYPLPGKELMLDESELLISGSTLADGYFTADGFFTDRFAGGRFYRTGDLVRQLPDGSFVFLGRVDRQVKILGRRIELEAIEAALVRAGALEARVETSNDVRGRTRLHALVAADVDVDLLRSKLRDILPDALMPARIVAVGSLPKNAAGKVDVRAARLLIAEPSNIAPATAS